MSRFIVRNHFSFLVVLIAFLVIVYLRFYFPVSNIISWDVFGYYLYLPALFIHNDLGLRDLSWVYQIIEQYQNTATFYQAFPGPEGSVVIKYSCGMAVFYAPGFFAAHLLVPYLGYAADGFSMPYQYAMVISGLIFSLAGMFILRKLLLKFFSDPLTSFLLLLVILGTNYLEMAYAGGLLTHNILFTLYALVLLLTIKWYDRHSAKTAFFLGIVIGLIILVRPTDGIILIIPLLWGVVNRSGLSERIRLFKAEYKSVLYSVLGLLLMVMPQLLYWKIVAGSFIYYSYINPGEGFDFLSPHTWNFLFSFRKGWLIYTPVMIFALLGFYMVWKNKREIFWSLIVFTVLYIYVVSSWSCWWYAGSFSARPMVQTYPVLAIPMGFMFYRIRVMKVKRSMILFFIAMFMLILNLFQHWQYSFGWILDGYRMTAPYYFRVFGKTHLDPEDRKLLMVERSAESTEFFTDSSNYRGRILKYLDFESVDTELEKYRTDTLAHSGRSSLRLDSSFIYSPGLTMKYRDITRKDHNWLRISVWVYSPADPGANPASLVVTFTHGQGGNYKYRTIDLDNPALGFKAGSWNLLTMDYMTPEVRSVRDNLSVYCWLRGKKPVFIDDLKVEAYEPL
ncbi:MAG: hypothetical protein AB9842_13945 [Bacteroidales bacterium]